MAARLAAFSKWAKTDAREGTAPARAKSPSNWAYFEVQVDPDGVLSPDERRRRAEAARKAHFLRLALKSAKRLSG